jgi:murein DD-endopeptidase MepM/ murein hydrolase activator NlpD
VANARRHRRGDAAGPGSSDPLASPIGRELTNTGTIDVVSRAIRHPAPDRRQPVRRSLAAELERIRSEAARLEAIFGTVTAADRLDSFVAAAPGVPGSNFGTRSIFNGEPRAPHAGTDFRGPTGTPIPAPAAGRVVLAEDLFFTGQTVVIDHGAGLYSLLAHLSRIDVTPASRGARRRRRAARRHGRVTGPHLHWTVRLNGARVDPLRLVALLAPAQSGAVTRGTGRQVRLPPISVE